MATKTKAVKTTTTKATKLTADTTAQSLFARLEKSRGRFFGLYLNSGEKINAQYRSQTERSLIVFDRNSKRNRRVDKVKVQGASI